MANTTTNPSILSIPFYYTFEEYEELHLILDRRRVRLAAPRRERSPMDPPPERPGISGYVIYAVIVTGLIAMAQFGDVLPGFLARRPGEDFGLKIFGPIFLFFACFSITAQIGRRAKMRGRRLTKTAAEKRATQMGVLYPVMGLVYVGVAILKSLDLGTTDTVLHDATMLIVPWIFIFVVALLHGRKTRKRDANAMKRTWDESPQLHREKRIHIDMQVFRLSDSLSLYEMNWELVSGEEGDNLFILIASGLYFIVPKRVLAAEQIEFIRDRLGLRPKEARTGGFPVLPAVPG
jgi:hypothetical protein